MSRNVPTLTHSWIWQAIDALAARKGLSPSALARQAGLDPTTFNKSKRFTPEGRPRWPSTESISKILDATGTPLDEFAEMQCNLEATAEGGHSVPANVPVVGEIRDAAVSRLAQAEGRGLARPVADFDQPAPSFALAVADASLEPVYSQGNTLIVSARESARAGDRVVVKPTGRPPIPRLLLRETARRIELADFRPEQGRTHLKRDRIEWIARIIWVRQ